MTGLSQSQNQKKRRRELDQFIEFASVCKCVLLGTANQPDPPEPDLVLPGPSGLIGIELTDVTLGGERNRAREGEQLRAMATAKELYALTGQKPVHAFFAWADNVPLSKRKRAPLAAAICEPISANLPTTGHGLRKIGDGPTLIRPDLPLTMITVGEASSAEAADWKDGSFHKVEPCGTPEIQAKIDQEDQKVIHYRVSYASRWVVLVLEAEGPSTWGVVLREVRQTRFRSQFDRVFLFELGHEHCHELDLGHTPLERSLTV